MDLSTDDIAALYAIACTADIKAGQAVAVGRLFLKIEAVIGRGNADPWIAQALTEERKQQSNQKPADSEPPVAVTPQP